jgi:hypothetical protein
MPGHAGYAQAGSGQSLSGITCLKGVIDTIRQPYDFREMFKKIHAIVGPAQVEDDHPHLF